MYAGKLSRFAGLVFVLAALAGGAGAHLAGAEHGTGGTSSTTNSGSLTVVAEEEATLRPAWDWQ